MGGDVQNLIIVTLRLRLGSKFNTDVYFIVGNYRGIITSSLWIWLGKSLLRMWYCWIVGEQWWQMYLTQSGRLQRTTKLQNVLQLNFYYHISVIVLLQSFVTVLDNLYSEQFYEQSWGVVLLPEVQKTTRFCPNFQSSCICIGFIAEKIR
jgi:hypothetical protein